MQAFDWMVASHKDLQVSNIHFEYSNLKVDPACMECSKQVIKFFQSPALKSLTLESMFFECLFPYLLESLQGRQNPLCSFSLLSTEIKKQPDKLIQKFFDILYSSPLLSEFELHLENNDFQPQDCAAEIPRRYKMLYILGRLKSCLGTRLPNVLNKLAKRTSELILAYQPISLLYQYVTRCSSDMSPNILLLSFLGSSCPLSSSL